MHKTNCIKLLKKLSTAELRRFREWRNMEGRVGRNSYEKKGLELEHEFKAMEKIANKDWLEGKFGVLKKSSIFVKNLTQ